MNRFVASVIVLALPVLLFSATSQSAECIFERVFDCNGIKCSDGTNAVKLFIDDAHSIISRCDSKGCDQFSVQLSQSGLMTTYGATEKGYMLRVNKSEHTFVEILTLMNFVILKYGKCSGQ